jgi:hypothetical protein
MVYVLSRLQEYELQSTTLTLCRLGSSLTTGRLLHHVDTLQAQFESHYRPAAVLRCSGRSLETRGVTRTSMP